jgi:hypothetical protein
MRPPDWRHRRAVDLVNSHRPASLGSDDPWVRQLLGELRSRRRGAGLPPHAASNRHDSAIATALELYAGGDTLRSVVEAYLMAAAQPAEIAERTGLPAAAIEAYHACFFDVSDRLARTDYIVHGIILAGASTSAAARRVDTAIKLAAYLGGRRALAELLPTPAAESEELAALLAGIERINDGLLPLLMHLTLLEPSGVSGEVAREALLHRIRRQATLERDENLTEYERSMEAILDSMQFHMRQKEDVEKCRPELRPYFHGAVEMRADELMKYKLTGELPPIENHMIEFPPPPVREAGAAEGGASDA